MIIGTAGHIDHGKTSLVRALTGVDTDRLPEEKKRGISVELGFAFLDGKNGQRIGFVDVPGHERLVHTMVAGATGMDYALLLVAADDGIMPQTREHLAVLSLLGLTRGAIVITKSDRVDAARLHALHAAMPGLLQGSSLQDAPIQVVSAHTGEGIDALRDTLISAAHGTRRDDAPDSAAFRLAVDRAFSLEGSGTTVTGTIHAGTISAGQEVQVMPLGQRVRVRSVHAQNRPVPSARAGQRCALVLAGIARDPIHRGMWVVDPQVAHSTQRVDMDLTLWHGEERALKSGTKVHVHMGSSSTFGTVAILQGDQLAPGDRGVAQLVLQKPAGAWWGDRVVLRDASGARTLGGGRILDADAPVRYRRSPARLAALDALAQDYPDHRLAGLLSAEPHGVDLVRFRCTHGLTNVGVPPDSLRHTDGHADWLLGRQQNLDIQARALQALDAFHERYPDQLGPDAARLRRLAVPRLQDVLWHAVLKQLRDQGRVIVRGAFIHSPDHDASLSDQDMRIAARVAPHVQNAGFAGAWVRDLASLCQEPEQQMRATLSRLARQGELHQVVKDLYYASDVLARLGTIARTQAAKNDGNLTAAVFRDAIGVGRKRAIQILEYFDRIGLMRRLGDTHRLRPESTLFQNDA